MIESHCALANPPQLTVLIFTSPCGDVGNAPGCEMGVRFCTSILKLSDDRDATLASRRRYVNPRSTCHTWGAHLASFWLQLIPAGAYVGTLEQL